MIPNQYEREVIKRILELHKQGLGLRAICRQLAEEGYKPRKQKQKVKGKTVEVDGKWNHITIRNVIARHKTSEEKSKNFL